MPTQAELLHSMAWQAGPPAALPVPAADPVENAGFSAQDFYRAANSGVSGRPIRRDIHRMFATWGHYMPEQFFADLQNEVDSTST